jgi:hypothetical protein
VGSTNEETWYWTGGNAINNLGYSEEVEVPEFTWRWFSTGAEIPKTFERWIKGEPKQDFDGLYQTFMGCAAVNSHLQMKAFSCRTQLPYICEEIGEA